MRGDGDRTDRTVCVRLVRVLCSQHSAVCVFVTTSASTRSDAYRPRLRHPALLHVTSYVTSRVGHHPRTQSRARYWRFGHVACTAPAPRTALRVRARASHQSRRTSDPTSNRGQGCMRIVASHTCAHLLSVRILPCGKSSTSRSIVGITFGGKSLVLLEHE